MGCFLISLTGSSFSPSSANFLLPLPGRLTTCFLASTAFESSARFLLPSSADSFVGSMLAVDSSNGGSTSPKVHTLVHTSSSTGTTDNLGCRNIKKSAISSSSFICANVTGLFMATTSWTSTAPHLPVSSVGSG
ncbi:hypothetical protein Mapa_010801 [Marchantia paleacea]|nr:hypothetical protein Mapa_010801 [Marchantia paleacea]